MIQSATTNEIYKELDKNNPKVIALLDSAKAFDAVPHKILLDKLYRYGIRGKIDNNKLE